MEVCPPIFTGLNDATRKNPLSCSKFQSIFGAVIFPSQKAFWPYTIDKAKSIVWVHHYDLCLEPV